MAYPTFGRAGHPHYRRVISAPVLTLTASACLENAIHGVFFEISFQGNLGGASALHLSFLVVVSGGQRDKSGLLPLLMTRYAGCSNGVVIAVRIKA